MQVRKRNDDRLLQKAFKLRQALALACQLVGEEARELRSHAYDNRPRCLQSRAKLAEALGDYLFGRIPVEYLELDYLVNRRGERFCDSETRSALTQAEAAGSPQISGQPPLFALYLVHETHVYML